MKKCYKYKENACCTILHDEYIREYTMSLLPESCLRKYPEFEDLLCLMCSPYESKYVVNNKLKLCKEFALKLWNATTETELTEPTKRFDNCGLMFPSDDPHFEILPTFDKGYFMPSKTGWSFTEFITNIGIPYSSFSSIEIIDSTKEDECFNTAYHITIKNIFHIIFLLFII